MPIRLQESTVRSDAFKRAERMGVLPSALSSREQREVLTRLVREVSVFSARTTNAFYLQKIREVLKEIADGGMGLAEARVVLVRTLDALGYTPEAGFPDDDVPVPPAVEGTLQDLRSFRRVDLILRTQMDLMYGAGQKVRGEEPASMRAFPAWELVRLYDREEPRNWQRRFREAGGELVDGRMIAIKGDPVWEALGDAERFDDALDVDHPPFCFNSGMRWRAVPRDELEELGVDKFVIDGEAWTLEEVLEKVPRPKVSASGLDPDFVKQLKAEIKAKEAAGGRLSFNERMARELERSGQK